MSSPQSLSARRVVQSAAKVTYESQWMGFVHHLIEGEVSFRLEMSKHSLGCLTYFLSSLLTTGLY